MTDFQTSLIEHLRAGYSGIVVRTKENHRAEIAAMTAASARNMGYERWTCISGWTKKPTDQGTEITGATEAVLHINKQDNRTLSVMHVFPEAFADPQFRQALRDVVARSKAYGKTLLLIGDFDIPTDLEKDLTLLKFALPTRDELRALALKLCDDTKIAAPVNGALAKVVDAALGLTIMEAENAYAQSLVRHKTLDIATILEAKKQIISKTGILEYVESPESIATVGGLDVLKSWLQQRAKGFTPKALQFGLEPPKGIILAGPPGTGKSLVAKAIQNAWGLPLLKLDMGRVFGGIVGESESNIRHVLDTAESVAPCILVIDEFERAMGGADGGNDGGTTQRVIGTLLNWMQDRPKDKPVFLVATANDLTRVPPQLLRKGRWDEIFCVDFPTEGERMEIAAIHLKKRGREALATPDVLSRIAKSTNEFTGSEIEEVVKAALWKAFAADREVNVDDLIEAAGETVPISKSMAAQVGAMREWAQSKARWASTKPKTSEGRAVDI